VKRVVVDASALAALIFNEPEGETIAGRLEGATVFAPALLKFEVANTAWRKARRHPEDAVKIMMALAVAFGEDSDIIWRDVQETDVVLLAHMTHTTAYDASYLWLAGSLGADLVTLDAQLAQANQA